MSLKSWAMRSNYKIIGDFIRPVKNKNTDGHISNLQGINIDKYYMPSVANIIGVDLKKYKVVKKNQFACNRMHVGRDKRLPVALLNTVDEIIVSPAYDVFEITDKKVLLPEYLMMWFSRKEFDRNCWFHTDADVRGGLSWDAFCNIKLPVPSPEKQQEIVNEYKTVVNRMQINEQLIQKLEDAAQTIYREWFVDGIDLDDLPEGWRVGKLTDLIKIKYGKAYSHLEDGDIPLYGSGGLMSKVNKALYTKPSVLIPRKGTLSNIMFVNHPFWCVDTMFYSIFNDVVNGYYSFYILKQLDFDALNQGSAVPSMTTAFLNDIDVVLPRKKILLEFNSDLKKIVTHKENIEQENQKLTDLKELLFSRMAVE